MTIVLAGGTGFLGRALHAALEGAGHRVLVLTRAPRSASRGQIRWTPDGTSGDWAQALDGADALVNLAGEGIADRRWNEARKQALRSSRLQATRSLVAALSAIARPPAVLVSGSAVGYYGDRRDEIVTESTPAGTDFLAALCADWEQEADRASSITRVAIVRTGIVMHPDGGALRSMLPPFRLGAGGPLGTGTQFMSWIHLDDWVALTSWLIAEPNARGAFNGTAPVPVTNRAFTRALGRALHRPALLRMPAFALRLLAGELAESLLTGQRAVPARAEEMGFGFRFREIEPALRALIP